MIADIRDLVATASSYHISRPWRSLALGAPVALGVAMVVAAFVTSSSARAELDESLRAMGADHVVVTPAVQSDGQIPKLPKESVERAGLLPEVLAVGALTEQSDHVVLPSGVADPLSTSAISTRVFAASPAVADALKLDVAAGRFLGEADERASLDVAVIGVAVARDFAIDDPTRSTILIDGRPFAVLGTLHAARSAPQLDRAVVVPVATSMHLWGDDGRPGQVIVRTQLDQTDAVAAALPPLVTFGSGPMPTARTASELLAARQEVDDTMNLLIGASGGLLLVVGVAAIALALWSSVLSRTSEIGLRRALGANRRHIGAQFVLESTLVGTGAAVVGGAVGVLAAASIAWSQDWPANPRWTLVVATCLLAVEATVVAGLVPARRAAQLEPLSALRA